MKFDLREMIEDDMDVVDALAKVTVLHVDPDTGATLTTALKVVALERTTDSGIAVPMGGEVPKTTGRFHLKASSIAFAPVRRDVIVEADGTKWNIERVNSVTLNTRYVCEVVEFV